ncbi:hypothetical protein PYW07_000175 [Mythimna separata]|uniref:Uncharacterized protein n=1 Tax=Mythimna separata TaxID=271217 RepID=A0AAD7Z3B6_MYTSE|nr:hypothetical protein PYW07_000175 [Mythimna separata]
MSYPEEPKKTYEMSLREMTSLNASSVAKCQQWRNDLLMKTDPHALSSHEIFKEPTLQKFQNQQAAQQSQFGQAGQHGQHGHGHHRHGQHGQHGQHGEHGQHGRHGHQDQHGQHGRHGQHGQQDQHGQHGRHGHSHHGHHGKHGHHGQHGEMGQHSRMGQHGNAAQQGLQAQQGNLCQHGQPTLISQPNQPAVPAQGGQLGPQMLANATVCCDQSNCDRAKLEQYFHEPATPFTLMSTDGCDPQSKKDPAEQYLYCPCGMTRGQLITICCTGRDCDNASKIDEVPMGPPEEKIAKTNFNQTHYKY